jgi:hypothetical protein
MARIAELIAFTVAFVLSLPFLPFALLRRRFGHGPCTIEPTTRPWGRRGPRRVMRWEVRGWQATADAAEQIAAAFERGDGAPQLQNATRN